MSKIEISYSIPTSKADILLEDWMEFEKIVNEEGIEEDFLQKRMLEIFCKVPTKYSLKLKQTEVDEILVNLNRILTVKSDLHTIFTFNKVNYGLIPDFDSDITAEELVLLDRYLQNKDYPRLLSILYRPITKQSNGLYQIEPFEESHTEFLKLRYDIFEGVLSFFLRLYEKLMIATLKYTQKMVKKHKMKDTDYQEKLNLLLSGVDIPKLFGS